MANIDIKQKHGPSPWGWIIGLIVLALVAWGAFELLDPDRESTGLTGIPEQTAPATETTDPIAEPGAPTAGSRFQAWVRDSAEALAQMGLEHEYTREGIQRMAAALEGLVAREAAPEIQQRLDVLKQQAQAIKDSDVASLEHAGQAREAFTTGAEILQRLAERPHLEGADLQTHVQSAEEAARAVQANKPLLEQRSAVHAFFQSMAAGVEAAERHYLIDG